MTKLTLFSFSPLAVSLAFLFSPHAMAQQEPQQWVEGKVVNEAGQPIKNAQVHIHGRQYYVYTDAAGNFRIQTPANSELHFAAKGFGDQFVTLSDHQTALSVQLKAGGVERIVVRASGLHQYDLNMSTPVSVLAGDELSRKTAATLGDTLKYEPGVNSSYYGPVASSPILRGLDGPRVRVLSNGLDTADVSRVGPDHAVSAEALTTEQIEVLRGPATLLYGSGAIGGVVNVVDNRIPRQNRSATTQIEGRYGDVSDEKSYALTHDGGTDQFAWHLDGFDRQSSDYQVPEFTNSEGETGTELHNSWLDNSAGNVGMSWLGSQGMIGLSYGHTNSKYGIPGHHHHEDEDATDVALADEAEPAVYAHMKQNRYGMAAELYHPLSGLENLSLNMAYTDFSHSEIEDGAVGTQFGNKVFEGRLSAEHEDISGWHGVTGLHWNQADFSATGEEAFTPDSKNSSYALFVLEEKDIKQFSYQLGGRIEKSHITAKGLDFIDHDNTSLTTNARNDFTATSLSAGLTWHFMPQYNFSASLSRSERAPSASELYANGAHLATNTYELGMAYTLDEDGEIMPNATDLQKEVANNLDLTLRKVEGALTFSASLFYNKVDNFLFLSNTGLTTADLHSDESSDEHSHTDVAIYQFDQQDARLYGGELELKYQLNPQQQVQLFVDTVRAELTQGGNLPRIPPVKLGAVYQYQADSWSSDISWTHYASQTHLSAEETATDAYSMIDVDFNYYLDIAGADVTAFVKLNNLTDELAFVHSSFIKTEAPLPGRNFVVGIKARF